MAKIETYVLATSPLSFSDMLIGTEINGPIPNATKNFSLQELYGLFATMPITGNLQQVLDTGNTAIQNIILTGDISSTTITPQYIVDSLASTGAVGEVLMRAVGGMSWAPIVTPNLQSVLNSGSTATSNLSLIGNLTVTKAIPGNIEDGVGNTGTTGQVLYKSSTGLLWANLPTVTTPSLQDVLNVGWVATSNIILTGTIDVTNIKPYSITDELNATGTINQVLTRSATGIRWDTPSSSGVNAVTASSPLASSGGSNPNLTIQQANGSQDGYLSLADWNTFNGKQSQLNGTGFVKASGTTISYDNNTYLTTGDAVTYYVPYTGANADVNLGLYRLTANILSVPDSAYGPWSVYASTLISGEPYFTIEDSKGNQRILISGVQGQSAFENAIIVQGSVGSPTQKSKLLFTSSGVDYTYTFPNSSGTIPLRVNGNSADSNGDITISTTGGGLQHGTASGTDTYTVTISGVTSYSDGDSYLIRFTNGNTTGATLNINSLGAKTLFRNNDGPIIGGDIEDGSEMLCVFNSTLDGFQVIGTSPNSLIAYVTNDDSVTITKGQAVYAFSGTGDRMTVKLAYNTTDATSAQTVGLVMSASIAPNQKGFIMMQGLLDGLSILPTATWSDGDTVYLGATAGSITPIKPTAPNHLVYLGVVTTASNGASGRLYVRVQNGYELQELHNVSLTSPPNNNDGLFYESSTSLWKNKSISTVLGYTPQAPLTGTGLVKSTAGTISYITDNSANWDTAYSDRLKWDGGATGLTASTGRTSLGATTVGSNFFTLANPSAITFPRINADNTVSALDASNFRTAIGTTALSQSAYTMLANNTNAAANMTAQTFRDVASATYTGAITWTAGTQPSGATNHSYRWTQIGKLVIVNVSLIYATAGATITSVVMDLPSDCPTPVIPAGISGNSRILYYGSGNMTGNGLLGPTASRAGLIINSTSTGYSLQISAGSAGYNWASITVQYFTS